MLLMVSRRCCYGVSKFPLKGFAVTDNSDEVRLTLRIPARIRDKLTAKGKEHNRSLNAEIVMRLERSIDFEDEYGTLEEVMQQVWTDIDQLKANVDELGRATFPQRFDWK
jgi:hypothetical protein